MKKEDKYFYENFYGNLYKNDLPKVKLRILKQRKANPYIDFADAARYAGFAVNDLAKEFEKLDGVLPKKEKEVGMRIENNRIASPKDRGRKPHRRLEGLEGIGPLLAYRYDNDVDVFVVPSSIRNGQVMDSIYLWNDAGPDVRPRVRIYNKNARGYICCMGQLLELLSEKESEEFLQNFDQILNALEIAI